jgi:hypothetical protein
MEDEQENNWAGPDVSPRDERPVDGAFGHLD